jgi:hypothetical protein
MSVLLPNESNALQMFKYVALSYTLFGCVDSAYTRFSGTGKEHGAEPKFDAPCFRGLKSPAG